LTEFKEITAIWLLPSINRRISDEEKAQLAARLSRWRLSRDPVADAVGPAVLISASIAVENMPAVSYAQGECG